MRLHRIMASSSSSTMLSSPFLPARPPISDGRFRLFQSRGNNSRNRIPLRVWAAKTPPGVEIPKVEPKFQAPFLGFTTTAEIWNARACMIGIIGTFIVESILNKGILQVIGVDVGKGLNLPL